MKQKNLRLVLQPSEGLGVDNAVPIVFVGPIVLVVRAAARIDRARSDRERVILAFELPMDR